MTTRLPALGIDMAKGSFDVHLLTETKACSHHFANTAQGFEALAQWLKQQAIEHVHACMEATGTGRAMPWPSSCIKPVIW